MRFKSMFHPSLALLGMLLILLSAACNKENEEGFAYSNSEIFGNGQKDISDVIARVGDVEITQKDFDLRFSELPGTDQKRYSGPTGQRNFLKVMVSEVVLYKEAIKSKVYLDPDIAQRLIALKRFALVGAFKKVVIAADNEPSEAEIRQFYEDNKDKYFVQGKVRAQHIQTSTKEKAQAAYDKIMSRDGRDALFPYVVGNFSENKETARSGGQIGWFNKGGVVPFVSDGPEFSNLVYDWDVGLHEPEKIGDKWHVVDILEKVPTRPKTISEARNDIITELKPILDDEKETELVARQLKELGVQYFGQYQPGNGRTPQELFKLGVMAKNLERQEVFLLQLVDDFPEDEYAPKALFLLANAFMDNYYDKRNARINLNRLLRDYPDSEIAGDAKYMLDNLNKAEFVNPKTIEELRGE